MSRWESNRWVIKDEHEFVTAWIAEVGDRYLLGIVAGPRAWYTSLAQAMIAGETHLRNDAAIRGAA